MYSRLILRFVLTASLVPISLSAVARAQTPAAAPQVRPALPQELLPAPPDATARERVEAAKAREEAQGREDQKLMQETVARGYWVDRSAGLMWAAKDNGEAVTWHKAASYCRNLQLAGFRDWRLATLDELGSLVDKSASTSDRVGEIETFSINLGHHVRGGLTLTGNPWSSTRELNRFGHPYGDGWFFDFVNSKPSADLPYFRNTKYALCVRRAGA